MPQVRVLLKKDGSIQTKVIGVKGSGCEHKTDFLDKLFGKPVAREHTEEYYEMAEEKETIQEGLPSGWCG